MKVFWILAAVLALTGCTTSYKHFSNPRVSGDGYDLICGGVEKGDRLTVAVDACYNVNPGHGEFIFIEVKKRWSK